MIVNGEHAQLLRRSPWRPDALVLGELAVVAITALVLGLLMRAGWLAALVAAGAVTLAICAVTAPRAFRMVAYIALAALPFITAWSALRPDAYNYPTYFAAFALALVGFGALQPRMFTASLGTLYLAYISVAATVALLATKGILSLPLFADILAAFAVYTLVRRADATERRLLIGLVLALACVESALAITQVVAGWPVFAVVLPELQSDTRNYFAYLIPGMSDLVTQGSGTFMDFARLGAFLALAAPLALGYWLEQRRSLGRLFLLSLVVAGVVVTFSRGALLGASAGMLFVLWFGLGRSRRAVITLALCCTVLVGILGFSVATHYYQSTQNLSARTETWQFAWDNALQQPSSLFLGYGYGHFTSSVLGSSSGRDTLGVRTGVLPYLHSGFLQLILEFGVLGLLLFLIWVFGDFRAVLAERRWLPLAAMGGVVGYLCSQAVGNDLFSYGGILMAAMLAVCECETITATRRIDSISVPRQGPGRHTGSQAGDQPHTVSR